MLATERRNGEGTSVGQWLAGIADGRTYELAIRKRSGST